MKRFHRSKNLKQKGHTTQKKVKKSGFKAGIHVNRSDFRKEREKWPQNTFWSVKMGKNKIRKIPLKSRNDMKKCLFWHYHNS